MAEYNGRQPDGDDPGVVGLVLDAVGDGFHLAACCPAHTPFDPPAAWQQNPPGHPVSVSVGCWDLEVNNAAHATAA